ncbi:MAG: cysteine peptidase family C39 domain-containing protein [Elainellaceae cyanobacterium]
MSLAFLGLYIAFMVVILNVPQMEFLPLEWRFHGMRITWGLMRVLLVGICGVAFTVTWHTARSQVVAIALVGLFGLGALGSAEQYLLDPIYGSLHDNLLPNGVFRQTSNSSCAPAALATVMHQWNLPVTESEAARLAETSRMGTSMPQLVVATKALDFDGRELRPDWNLMLQINRPGVLSVWLITPTQKLPHAVALLGLNPAKAVIADPSSGQMYDIDRVTFDTIWRGQYVPVFKPEELLDGRTNAPSYLSQLGYNVSGGNSVALKQAIAQFQQDFNLKATGELDDTTLLALSGSFLEDQPRLDRFENRLAPGQPGSDVRHLL